DNSQRRGFRLGIAADEGFARWNLSSQDPSAWSRQACDAHAAGGLEANGRSRGLQLQLAISDGQRNLPGFGHRRRRDGIFTSSTAQGLLENSQARSEERRVGKECRTRWSRYQ